MSAIETVYTPIPVGYLELSADDTGISSIRFVDAPQHRLAPSNKHLNSCISEVEAYFAGKLKQFSTPISQEGTNMQRNVWQALAKIPYGTTTSYKQIAISIGDAKFARAVGNACNKNPLPLLVPCHRVISSNGLLTGFNGGLWIKQWLLEHEGAILS